MIEGLYRVVTPQFGGGVVTLDQTIVQAPPYLRKFIGQDLHNLQRWITAQRGRVTRISEHHIEEAR